MIDKAIHEHAHRVMNGGNQRNIAEALELYAGLDDYYGLLQEGIENGTIKFDSSITVSVDGKKIKFDNIDKVAEWILSNNK